MATGKVSEDLAGNRLALAATENVLKLSAADAKIHMFL
jgi:hypothetical protein